MRLLLGTALLSAAALMLQVALTRVFSIAQYYHFAFLVISLALLGYGASGSLLTLWPSLRQRRLISLYAIGFSVSLVGAYLFVNHLPFDSYHIATDRSQIALLIINLLVLAIPFVFAGGVVGLLLSGYTGQAGRFYGASLLGSAGGAVLSPLLLTLLGSERVVLLCAVFALGTGLVVRQLHSYVRPFVWLGFLGGLLAILTMPAVFAVQPSPYKALSTFRLNPNATIVSTRQNAVSRLDVVESTTIHSAPGLSAGYMGPIPPQMGLLVDGDTLMAVSDTRQASDLLAEAMPSAAVYPLQPGANVLLLGSGGNMEAWVALANGASSVTVVEPNRLVYDALAHQLSEWAGMGNDPRLMLLNEQIRTYVQRHEQTYDVVQLTLADNYRPITSGAFTLSEDYTLTVEAFQDYFELLGEDSYFVITRWLQAPPSEELRVLAIILDALDAERPLESLVVFRSYQAMTFIVKPASFTAEETALLLQHIETHQFDLVLAPIMPASLINRFARLEAPVYHDTLLQLATTGDRAAFYARYLFDVSPPTDDHPFFHHFFRWEQTAEVLENLGRRWQPFGGSGFLVLIALLLFVVAASIVFVLLPVGVRLRFRSVIREVGAGTASRVLLYFASLGLAFMMVEIALIQRYTLILGQPTLAMAVVLGALLFSSGIGSIVCERVSWRVALVLLVLLLAVYPLLTDSLSPMLLVLPQWARFFAVSLLIMPVAFLMGIPFSRGIVALEGELQLVPWAWASLAISGPFA